jgi:DNA-binding NtrC family response regulator
MEMVHFIPSSQRRLALLAAQSDSAPALIVGGSGTGKGAIARWIHENGPRVARPLVTAQHDTSLGSQILHAQGGTLIVPDIGEWPLGEQRILLDFLKNRSVPHLDTQGMRMIVNVRVIATTSQSLEGRARGGLFNPELLEKLNVFRIEMPPLAKRGDEFDDIAVGVASEIMREVHKEHLRGFSDDAWIRLKAYDWPGNIRELRNVLRLAVVAAAGDVIEVQDLPEFGPSRIDFRATREEFERIYLLELLKTFDWDIEKATESTRMDRATLITKINKYELFKEKYQG